MANDVRVEVDQTGKPAKNGDGNIGEAVDDKRRKAKWAERVAYWPDPTEKQRKIISGSRLWAAVMALTPRPPVFKNPISGVVFAWASNRQYREADNNLTGLLTVQQWHDICDVWTEGLKNRAWNLEKSGRLDLAFDETIEQSGLRFALGKDESNSVDRVDTFDWGDKDKKRFLLLWMSDIDWSGLYPPPDPDGKPKKAKYKVKIASLGLDQATLDQIRNPSFSFKPRRGTTYDFNTFTEKEA